MGSRADDVIHGLSSVLVIGKQHVLPTSSLFFAGVSLPPLFASRGERAVTEGSEMAPSPSPTRLQCATSPSVPKPSSLSLSPFQSLLKKASPTPALSSSLLSKVSLQH